jgi:two-component system LytT family sensor kinase
MDPATDHSKPPPMTGRYLLGWAVSVAGVAVLLIWYHFLSEVAEGTDVSLLQPVITEGTGVLGGGLMYFPIRALVYRWPLIRGQLLARIPIYLASLAVLSLLHTTWNWGTRLMLYPLAGFGAYDYGRMPVRYLMELPADIVIFGFVVGGIHIARRLNLARQRELQAAQLESTLAHAQLDNLRLRLQPHFLFNTLNTVSSVMYDDPEKADRILDRLGGLLRTSLRHGPTDVVPLADEITTVRAYLDIVAARFGERIDVSLEIDPAATAIRIPVLLLQPLVENAVRHGRLERDGRGTIRLEVARRGPRLAIDLWNDGSPREETAGTGLGLTATRERLRLTYGDDARLDAGPDNNGFRVRLDLPTATLGTS